MWLRSVYLKTLREARIAILGWGSGLGLLLLAVLSAVPSLLTTPEARESLVSLSASFTWFAEPIAVDTPGGYATWKYGPTILILAIWPLLTCSRLFRGEEEQGALDTLLSVPRGRWRVGLEKLAAVWTALLGMGVIIGLLAYVGGQGVNAGLGLGDTLLFALNLVLISGVFGALALLIAQFVGERRAASGITGGLLFGAILLDMVHRVLPEVGWISRLSPVYYYNLSRALIPSYGANAGGMLMLLILNLLLAGAGLSLFVRRDIGGVVALPVWLHLPERRAVPARALPERAWSLRSVYARGLGMIAVPAGWWTLAIAGLAGWMVVIAKQTAEKLSTLYESSPILRDLISKVGGGEATSNNALLSTIFVFLPLLMMAFAVTQASHWSSDEEDGLQDLVLATPQSRLTVLLARFGALTTATVIIGFLTLASTAFAAAISGLTLDWGNLAAATLSLIPMGLLMAAVGYLLSGWLRTAVDTGLMSFLLVIWFVITFIGPELKWSDATLRLSAFYYYGTPLVHGLRVLDMAGVLIVTAAALALASARFVRKDIGR